MSKRETLSLCLSLKTRKQNFFYTHHTEKQETLQLLLSQAWKSCVVVWKISIHTSFQEIWGIQDRDGLVKILSWSLMER